MPVRESHQADRKNRWHGLLEHPRVFEVVKGCLDGFSFRSLSETLRPFSIGRVLEVCCGVGGFSGVCGHEYIGLDNSFRYLGYASSRSPRDDFVLGDAEALPFRDESVDAAAWIGASHHFSDEGFRRVVKEMARVSGSYLIFDDAVLSSGQTALTKFFYAMDRGVHYRNASQVELLISVLEEWEFAARSTYRSFPGIYVHAVYVLRKKSRHQAASLGEPQ